MSRSTCTVFALLLIAAACQRGRDRAAEGVVERAIEAGGREAKVTIDSAKGAITVTLGGAVRPRDWPDSVPLYPQASRAAANTDPSGARALSVLTDDSLPDLSRFYREELSKNGWELTNAEDPDREWGARRHSEALRLRFHSRARGSRAELEYRANS